MARFVFSLFSSHIFVYFKGFFLLSHTHTHSQIIECTLRKCCDMIFSSTAELHRQWQNQRKMTEKSNKRFNGWKLPNKKKPRQVEKYFIAFRTLGTNIHSNGITSVKNIFRIHNFISYFWKKKIIRQHHKICRQMCMFLCDFLETTCLNFRKFYAFSW